MRLQPGSRIAATSKPARPLQPGNGRIHYLERSLADAEMPALYVACDIVLHFPSSDATPVSMLEALASGCAVICSDALDAYRVLAGDYQILRLPLEKLDDTAVRAACDLRSRYGAANAETIGRLHSRERTVDALRPMIEALVPGPTDGDRSRGKVGRSGAGA